MLLRGKGCIGGNGKPAGNRRKANTANPSDGAGNNRRVQALGDRTLYMFHEHEHDHDHDHDHDEKDKDGASTLMASAAALAAVTLLSF